tara:strand:+ start:12786 stop:12977 length:192 start_codon:yes stop_codon:yes gene_type:complete
LNPQHSDYKTDALPIGAISAFLVLSTRLELVFPDYQSDVLPLNYESILYLVDMAGIEPATSTL